MSTVAKIVDPRIITIEVTEDEIIAHLVDGRTISVPLVWSWRLADATREQRQHWEILGDGEGVRWPDIDEDISVEGMLHGIPAIVPEDPQAGSLRRSVLLFSLARIPVELSHMLSLTNDKQKEIGMFAR